MPMHPIFKSHASSSQVALYGASRFNVLEQHLRHQLSSLIFGLSGLSLAFIATGALIYKSQQSALVPYLVTVDSHGVVLAGGELKPSTTVPHHIITAQICEFIRNLRMLTEDTALQQQAILKAYAFVEKGSQSAALLNEFYQKHNPLAQEHRASRQVMIVNAIAVNDHTLQVDWREQTKMDTAIEEKKMRALITYTVRLPDQSDAETLLLNPLCISIHEFVLSEILE